MDGSRPAATSPCRKLREPLEAHEEDDRAAAARERGECLGVVGQAVAVRDRDPIGDTTVRDRDQRGRRDGRDARDARRHRERDPRRGQRERLLAAAAEDERVAALEPDDIQARVAVLDEQRVDLGLAERRPRDEQRVGRRLGDELGRDEHVVDEHVAGAEELEPAGGDQTGIARAGADEVDGHESARSTSRSK